MDHMTQESWNLLLVCVCVRMCVCVRGVCGYECVFACAWTVYWMSADVWFYEGAFVSVRCSSFRTVPCVPPPFLHPPSPLRTPPLHPNQDYRRNLQFHIEKQTSPNLSPCLSPVWVSLSIPRNVLLTLMKSVLYEPEVQPVHVCVSVFRPSSLTVLFIRVRRRTGEEQFIVLHGAH